MYEDVDSRRLGDFDQSQTDQSLAMYNPAYTQSTADKMLKDTNCTIGSTRLVNL